MADTESTPVATPEATSETTQDLQTPESPVGSPAEEGNANPSTAQKEKRRYPWLGILSLLLCIAAWVAATKSGYATLGIGAAAIVAGAFALGSHRPAIRNTAITSIIATAVLLLVVGTFMFVLHKMLG